MLNTLITLGKEIAQEQGEWDNLIEIPIFNEDESIENYVLIITFDIDRQTIVVENNLHAFGIESSPIKYRNLKSELWGRNGDPWMVTCTYPKKLPILQKSIFGKVNSDSEQGLFQKALLRSHPEAKETLFYKALEACYSLRNVEIDEGKKGIDVLENEYISKKLSFPRNHKIVMLSIAIKSELLGINAPTLLCNLDGYDYYVKKNFIKTAEQGKEMKESLCYATGKKSDKTTLPTFSDREDLNKLFVTTTINYAPNFNKKDFEKYYQIDLDIQKALQNGSNYIRGKLNNQRCSVRIANTEHYIIPTFLDPENVDMKFELDQIQQMSEWVFSTKQLENTFESLGMDAESPLFWINYIAYASDGNSVKVINHIKDVSNVWFGNIIRKDMEQSELISNYFNQRRSNLSTIYFAIPIRKEHEQKNDALKLLSQILEQRKVRYTKIFYHFTELILCHYYNRYNSYSNITYKPEDFDLAIRDSALKYLFLINLLKALKLIDMDMEENEKPLAENEERADKLQRFFSDMGYSPQQQALYWLGRIIRKIGTAQYNKNHKQKPVLNKINYNGMDHSKIQRLYVDAFELSTQYKIVNEINYCSKMFSQLFPADETLWTLTPQESVFYILSGFSLYIDNNQ
ncbi:MULTISPECIES: TM1802 family CRISPR-associated protein [unclassified Proteiniphilum]|jgi:CRISPR-associated protein Csh1|uniref:TM1802 family CRISPR-associated protein n=1 Tax=unclassified Proteiniphilum TaxID=2622718 RepID=UPI00257FF4EB|nr:MULTISPECIES: TM1802 family CRISPR-associated protein [unclassified Proteiniphilum]